MPHQCIACGRSFPDGSKEMLSGCPECGGNKFQFHPAGQPPENPADPSSTGSSVTEAVGSATSTVRDLVSGGCATSSGPPRGDRSVGRDPVSGAGESDTGDSEDPVVEAPPTPEDSAQADARSGMVHPDELPRSPPSRPRDARREAPDEPDGSGGTEPPARRERDTEGDDQHPDLAALREELNDQFESIRIVEPGEYELNLMELYDRQEYIIALQENGRYVIQAAESWTDG